MPTHLIKINLDQLFPPFVTPLLETLAECERRGKSYVVYSGYRDFKSQAKLWTQGRTLMFDPKGNKLPIVTNAQAGFSAHNYGIAVDCYLDDHIKPGLQPVWTTKNGEYDLLKEVGEKWGFQVGVPTIKGGDPGHLQIGLTKIYAEREAKILGGWKKLVKDEGERKALETIWRDLTPLWPLDMRPGKAP